jgi:hypothetical protein
MPSQKQRSEGTGCEEEVSEASMQQSFGIDLVDLG